MLTLKQLSVGALQPIEKEPELFFSSSPIIFILYLGNIVTDKHIL